MHARCANPACSAELLCLTDGRMYILPTSARTTMSSERRNFFGSVPGVQYAWLCDTCARKMTIKPDRKNGIKVKAASATRKSLSMLTPLLGIGLAAAATLSRDLM